MPSSFKSPLSRSANNNDDGIVTIDLSTHPPNAKLGMLLAPGSLPAPISSSNDNNNSASSAYSMTTSPTASNVTLVAGWEHEHGNNQQLGPIQRSGMVRLGDRLVRINKRDVTDWTFREVMDVLKEMILSTNKNKNNTTYDDIIPKRKHRRLTTLGFAPAGTEEWSRGVMVGGEEFNSTSLLFGLFQSQESKVSPHVISKRLYSFVSFIGRWRVVDEPPDESVVVAATNATSSSNGIVRGEHDDILEAQLHKEPSMKFASNGPIDIPEEDNDENDDHSNNDQSPNQSTTKTAATPSIFSPEAEAEWHKEITDFQEKNTTSPPKKIVQYEIQCHLLLRDRNSFKSNTNHHHGNKNNVHHHSWSVWKRYSEFQSLDSELRNVFGWQMDAIDEGKGIVFPSVHGLESWWYGWRNGGGYFTKMMGGSYGVNVDSDAREEEDDDDDKEDGDIKSNSSTTCPYPKPFIEKRQKELGSYWISISKIEDIFEFSDMTSHRFSRLMASFLEVDKVLLSKRSNSGRDASPVAVRNQQHQRASPTQLTIPVIHENETELFSFGAAGQSEKFQSPITPSREFSASLTFNDDDVSMLSDGTGNNGYLSNRQNDHSPIPAKRLLVDNVPAQLTSNNDKPIASSGDRSVSSKSTRRRGVTRKTKPAFQLQFLD